MSGLFSLNSGSSPPARGILKRRLHEKLGRRFIPACAGNTVHHGWFSIHRAVHPRLRGEYTPVTVAPSQSTGSSPPARGILCPLCRHLRCTRFIPACAGNTRFGYLVGTAKTVHPRLRGEYLRDNDANQFPNGSSPPARGIRSPDRSRASLSRFIPACAGNTRGPCVGCGPEPVHPRLRGEYINSCR